MIVKPKYFTDLGPTHPSGYPSNDYIIKYSKFSYKLILHQIYITYAVIIAVIVFIIMYAKIMYGKHHQNLSLLRAILIYLIEGFI